ncbi:MAG: hypothetical protein ACYDAG_06710 [Chloroflexota bacterium]
MPGPPITLDMDGVICTPFLNSNIAISRGLALPPLPPAVILKELTPEQRRGYQRLRRRWEYLRYLGRRPLPGVMEGLRALAQIRQPVLVTGRSWFARSLIERWLTRHGLAEFFDRLLPNNTALASGQFKLWTSHSLGSREHVDDDGSIAYYLANQGLRVYLRDWPRNRGLPYPRQVTAYHLLTEVAEHLSRAPADDGTGG